MEPSVTRLIFEVVLDLVRYRLSKFDGERPSKKRVGPKVFARFSFHNEGVVLLQIYKILSLYRKILSFAILRLSFTLALLLSQERFLTTSKRFKI